MSSLRISRYNSDIISYGQFAKVAKFVEDQTSSHPAFVNMGTDGPAGFLFNIFYKRRWTYAEGEIAMLEDDDQIIGVSAVERSSFHNKLTIGGIRMWVDPRYRGRPMTEDRNSYASKLLLSSNLDWSDKQGMWAMMVTFNDYNKTIFEGIKRKASGKGVIGDHSDWWSDGMPLDRMLNVRNVSQYCVLKPLDRTGCQTIKESLS